MKFRRALPLDLKALTDIYNYEILNGTATFDEIPKTVAQRHNWLEAHNHDGHPLIVSINDHDEVTGFASLSAYGAKDAFKTTAELSVYVAKEHRGLGLGTALTREILKIARDEGQLHLIISVITHGNMASCKMHQALGFQYQGTIPQIAKKFDTFLGVDFYTLTID